MDFVIEPDSKNQIIRVKTACLLTQDKRKLILLEITRQLNITGFSKVMIDLTESSFNPDEPMTGALELTNFLRSLGIQPHVKFAFIYSGAESHRKYFENVAQSDGFNLRYFNSLNKAVLWLE